MNRSLLIIEDEPGLVTTLRDRFENEFYNVTTSEDGQKGYHLAREQSYDLIILDLMLPAMSGLEICKKLRAEDIDTPILMLTAKGQLLDKILGLKLGADDYLPKPFEFEELLARVEAIIRRTYRNGKIGNQHQGQMLHAGPLKLSAEAGEAYINDIRLELSVKEFKLLEYMMQNKGKVVTREQLLNKVWGYDALPSTRTVDTHIAWIRQKIEPNPKYPKYLLTVHSRGYKLLDSD